MVTVEPTLIITFLLWTGSVAGITFYIVSKCFPKTGNEARDYFAGGNALKWYVVAGSLMLTNLSSEQLVGLNGTVFKDGNMVGMWWEAGASVTIMLTAAVFLPTYMKQGIITTSSYLGERYDTTVRTMVASLFVVYYSTILCPLVLYAGALAVREIFGWTEEVELFWLTTSIGTLGAAYAISGGLKAVAVSDCLNGIGLLIVGLWIPLAAIQKLDNGFMDIFSQPERLEVIATKSQVYNVETLKRSLDDTSLPWHTIPIGLTLNNIYYWSTNQVIVQRALGAQSLAQGQKGVLFAACMKVMGFSFLCMPGMIAGLLQDQGVLDQDGNPFVVTGSTDTVYPKIVNLVMPLPARGFFLGVLIGSVLSTYNSALNSASTMFALEFYKVFWNKDATDKRTVLVANIFGVGLTLVSFVIAPQFEGLSNGLFITLQIANTIISLPILAVFFVGIFFNKPDAFAAKVGFIVGAITIGGFQLAQFLGDREFLHFLHVFEFSFFVAIAAIILATYSKPFRRAFRQSEEAEPFVEKLANNVDLTPWPFRYAVIVSTLAVLGWLLTSMQLANETMISIFWVLWLTVTAGMMLAPVPAALPARYGSRPSIDSKGSRSTIQLVDEK